MRDYLIFTRTYGILRKRDDNIRAARLWAKRFDPGEVVSVVPEHKTGTPVADLEVEWRATLAQRGARIGEGQP